MAFDALGKQDIDTLRSVLFTLGSVLKEMQEQRPALRLDISQWPRVVIDVPSVSLRDIIARSVSDASRGETPVVVESEPAARDVESVESAPTPEDVEWLTPDTVPDAVKSIQDSALLAVRAATGVAAAAKGEMPRMWTEEEDKAALQMFAGGFGYEEIAAQLGRPVGGVKFRFDTKWKAIRESRKPAVETPKLAPLPPQPVPTAAPLTLPAFTSVQAAISRRLDTLSYRNGHNAKTDFDLVQRLSMGEKLQIIAADWREDPRGLKSRFADLCGSELPSPQLQADLLVVLAARVLEAA